MPKILKALLFILAIVTSFIGGMWYEMKVVADLIETCVK
jgi:uncharacterized protein YneF (UPF0154 family)